MASKKPGGYKCRIAIVLLVLLGSIAALIAVAVIQHKWASTEYNLEYGIVIDSGSSRSSIYLYEWPGEKENETGVVTQLLSCKVDGVPISEMKVDPEKDSIAWKGFQKCMEEIGDRIPDEKHKSTTLFLGATAGMRLLQEQDEKRAAEVLTSLKEYLSSLPFIFHNASIITGQEEGLYGWITVNYVMGNLLEKNLWNTYMRPEGAQTVGSLDLGGASTQIAFAVEEDLKGADYLPVKLYGYTYNVYTHSFLCFGKNEAGKRLLDKVVKASPDPNYILNPCYQDGFEVTRKASDIYDSECTEKPANYDPDRELRLVGAPDSDKCGRLVRSLFDFETCSSAQCSYGGVEQPPVRGQFMAYAGFFFTARCLLLNGTSEMDKFNSSIGEFCHTNWTQLRKEKDWISERYLKTYCYSAHYVFTMLAEGYKFDKDTWSNIMFVKEVNGVSVGWSLGYMLQMSNMIPSEVKHTTPMTNPVFAGLVFLFSALIIVMVVIAFIFLIRTCY